MAGFLLYLHVQKKNGYKNIAVLYHTFENKEVNLCSPPKVSQNLNTYFLINIGSAGAINQELDLMDMKEKLIVIIWAIT